MQTTPDRVMRQGARPRRRTLRISGSLHFRKAAVVTNVYIDGFNLYYGSLKGNPTLKWLNPAEMCRILLPNREIHRIRYFTARISPLPHDPQAPHRQSIYLRALETIPNLTIHLGEFARRRANLPLADKDPTEIVTVIKMEEKRSDVNLATYLLVDCFDGEFDEAVVISNDSDLTLPIKMVSERFGKRVGTINPSPRKKGISRALIAATDFQVEAINRRALADSQFPDVLSDARGEFHRPPRWG